MPTVAEVNDDTKDEIRDVCYTLETVVAATSQSITDTVRPTYYNNTGASAPITLTLPTALKGKEFTIERAAAFQVIIDPSGVEYFAGSSAGLYKSLDSDDTYINVKCLKDGIWHILAQAGSVSDE